MKFAFFEISDLERKKFSDLLFNDSLLFFESTIQDTDINLFSDCDAISVFIHSKVTEDILSKLVNLKLVATRSTGFDHIDSSFCEKHHIDVKNVPLYGEYTVAEHTFALILSLTRKIHTSYVRSIKGDFRTEGLQGFDLKDKTIGIIGGGRIGLHVARMARSFGMHVRVFDIKKDNFLAELINFKYVSLNDLLSVSDIVSLHLPLNDSTYHLINSDSLKLIKRGSLLINTARGGLVDTDALIVALNDGTLSGVGLDVIEGEEFLLEENIFNLPIEKAAKLIVSSKILLDNENVVMTPHNAFNSVEAVSRIVEATVNNLKSLK